jgi:hypothetical protein
MKGRAPRATSSNINQIANELCELFQQQIDTLQRGMAETDKEEYLQRRRQIREWQAQLKARRPRPS